LHADTLLPVALTDDLAYFVSANAMHLEYQAYALKPMCGSTAVNKYGRGLLCHTKWQQ